MQSSLGSEAEDRASLISAVHRELLALRGRPGVLTIQKFSGYANLRRVCGEGDLLDAYFMFEREMKHYASGRGRDEVAAAISITAPAETVLDRLEHVVATLPQGGKLRDQRTARRWSDAGLHVVATDLVHMAEIRGRLGTELLSVEIRGNELDGLTFIIDQMTNLELAERAPLVRAWHYPDSDKDPREQDIEVDLNEFPAGESSNVEYKMRRHIVKMQLPPKRYFGGEAKILGLSIEGRDAPMRTVMVADSTDLRSGVRLQSTVYRSIVMFDLVAWQQS